MRSKRQTTYWSIGAVLILATAALVVSRFSNPEPVYEGVPLTEWLDGTMRTTGVPPSKVASVIDSIGPEAIPHLLAIVEGRVLLSQRIYSRLYGFLQPATKYLPKPRLGFTLTARYNAARELSRLAPGTQSEGRVVAALLSLDPGLDKRYERQYWFTQLSAFTNCSDKIVPVLLTGVTNPATFDASVEALSRFGTSSVPDLYRMAKAESGFIRPAELALKRIDEKTYLRLSDEKSSPP